MGIRILLVVGHNHRSTIVSGPGGSSSYEDRKLINVYSNEKQPNAEEQEMEDIGCCACKVLYGRRFVEQNIIWYCGLREHQDCGQSLWILYLGGWQIRPRANEAELEIKHRYYMKYMKADSWALRSISHNSLFYYQWSLERRHLWLIGNLDRSSIL